MIAIRRRTVRPLKSRITVETLEKRILLTTVMVNTVVDAIYPPGTGLVSLRNAVTDANGSSTPTTITFDPKVFATTQTIQLRGTPLVFNNIANHDRRRSGGWKNARTTDGSEAPRN